MLVSSSEGFCREGLLGAILFREADMLGDVVKGIVDRNSDCFSMGGTK